MGWVRAGRQADLVKGPIVFKDPPRQIAIFAVGEHIHAVDNRCPHEGYPLAQGAVGKDGVLTCRWHNWKFRLADGACVIGGDDVRAYAVETRGDEIWLDVRDPPIAEIERRILRGLRRAFEDRDHGRICREIARLSCSGLDPLIAVRHAIEWAHDRLEYGTDHAFAAAADWLHWAEDEHDDPVRQIACLAEAVDHMAEDVRGEDLHPFPAAGDGEGFDESRFLEAVEAEDAVRATAMIARAVADGMSFADMEGAFARAALAHYNDFGHSLIYVQKTAELIERVGGNAGNADRNATRVTGCLSAALARSLTFTTREDLLPEFASYAPALAQLTALGAPGGRGAARGAARSALQPCWPGSVKEQLAWLSAHWLEHDALALHGALLEAAARNLLCFDTSYESARDGRVDDNVGWLDFTHALTFASAVRELATRYEDLWLPGLAQMACFVGRNHGYIDAELALALDAHGAKQNHDVDAEADAVMQRARERVLDHGLRDPIYSAHLLKTTCAVALELPFLGASGAVAMLAALERFLGASIKQKHTLRTAAQALDLVRKDYA